MKLQVYRVLIVFVLASGLSLQASRAQEPEQLPPPKQPFVAPAPEYFVPYPSLPPPPPRLDTRGAWAYYGVDSAGRFRPRVVLSPYGSYYLYTREPYPWAPMQPRDLLPRTSD
jgi:hypothetical protein